MKRVIAFLFFVGCATAPPRPDVVVPAPAIELMSAGKAPLVALRYTPKVGRQETLLYTASMGFGVADSPEAKWTVEMLPPITMTADLTATKVDASGTFDSEFVVRAAGVTADPELPIESMVFLQDAIEPIISMKGWSKIDARGVTLTLQADAPAGANPTTLQMYDNMRPTLTSMSVPFPEEPVGVGGSWRVVSDLKGSLMALKQSALVQVVAIAGNEVTLRITIEQTAPPQRMESNGDSKVDLLSLSSTGTGDVIIDLTRLVPTSATYDAHTMLVTKTTTEAGDAFVTMHSTMRIDYGPP